MKKADFTLMALFTFLVFFGLVVLGSASIVISEKNYGENYYYFKHQLISIAIGFVFFFILQKLNYMYFKKVALGIFAGSIVFMILVFLPHIGVSYQGASRWIQIGGLSFQPAELLKLSFIIYFASWLDSKKKEIRDISSGFLPMLTIIAVPAILLMSQPDIGTLGVLIMVAFVMYFAANSKLSHLFSVIAIMLVAFAVLAFFEPYRFDRIKTYFNPGTETLTKGYQINQSLIAIGSGGLFGKGLGQSVQKYNFLPEPIGDSIFAILAEELGFVGSIAVISLFMFLLWRGFRISKSVSDGFGKLLAIGLTSLIVIQAYVNIMSISGLIPLTGIPLPFFSYGGSAMVAILAACGILLNISKHAKS